MRSFMPISEARRTSSKAVLTRDQDRILRSAEDFEDLSSAVPVVIAYMLGPGRPYATLVAHAALHGMPWDVEVQGHATRRLIELAASEAERGRASAWTSSIIASSSRRSSHW